MYVYCDCTISHGFIKCFITQTLNYRHYKRKRLKCILKTVLMHSC